MTVTKMFKLSIITLLFVLSTVAIGKDSDSKILVFFYSSDCEYCHQMADILINIRNKHGVRIIANSIDGKKIPQFPNSISDVALMRKFKIVSIPILIAVDMSAKKFEVMSVGLEIDRIVEAKVIAWINNA